MQVIDSENSERGPQRKRAVNGRPLHCCCICGAVDVWGSSWSVYCSDLELDEERPIPKFCSTRCADKGGRDASDVTEAMKQKAKDAEWRSPKTFYREATGIEKFRDAVQRQKVKPQDQRGER